MTTLTDQRITELIALSKQDPFDSDWHRDTDAGILELQSRRKSDAAVEEMRKALESCQDAMLRMGWACNPMGSIRDTYTLVVKALAAPSATPKGARQMKRPLIFKTPEPEQAHNYEPLKSVAGEIVGWKCKECGRLCEAPHFDHCSIGRKQGRPTDG